MVDGVGVDAVLQAWMDVLGQWPDPVYFWCEDGRLELTFGRWVAGELVECEQSVSVVTADGPRVGLTTVVRHAPLGKTGWSRDFHASVVEASGSPTGSTQTLEQPELSVHLEWAHPRRVPVEGSFGERRPPGGA